MVMIITITLFFITLYVIYLTVVLMTSEILYKEQAYAVPSGLLSFLKVEIVFTYFFMIKGSQLNSISNKKAIPLKAWTGPEGSRRLKIPDFMTIYT